MIAGLGVAATCGYINTEQSGLWVQKLPPAGPAPLHTIFRWSTNLGG